MYSPLEEQITDDAKASIPQPQGYRILIAIPKVEEVTKGGIHIPDKVRDAESVASVIGYVMALGPIAYQDENKFPTGPWCKEGDYVVIRSYSGTRFKIDGNEFRLINDDTVEAVVDDPRKIMRAY